MDPRLSESFNNIKNKIYKNTNFSNRYAFEDLSELLKREDLSQDELKAINLLKRYSNNIIYSVEDLGTKIMDITTLDFTNKIRVEDFIKDIILIIDEFIDSLTAIINVIKFDKNRIDVQKSLARLKSLRNSLIQQMNKYMRLSSGVELNKDQAKIMQVLLADIIDSIIQESFQLRIQNILKVINNKF